MIPYRKGKLAITVRKHPMLRRTAALKRGTLQSFSRMFVIRVEDLLYTDIKRDHPVWDDLFLYQFCILIS
jgi:hypothetical protein